MQGGRLLAPSSSGSAPERTRTRIKEFVVDHLKHGFSMFFLDSQRMGSDHF